jgi:Asp-tRNA(Asn)/Glu-tRNA(Gln) amidotransferase C subunit
MYSASGIRTSLLNQKIHAASKSSYLQDPAMGGLRRTTVHFSLIPVEVDDVESDTKGIVAIYIIDVTLHEPKHDEVMMQQLNLLIINPDIQHAKVLFRNSHVDRNKFNKLYNLIRLNVPNAVMDLFPSDCKSIYEYVENMDDDDNHYLSFHPYIDSIEIVDILFENTILNIAEYRKHTIDYTKKQKSGTTVLLCLGMFVNASKSSIWYDYVWLTKSSKQAGSVQKKICETIFKFGRHSQTFNSLAEIEACDFVSSSETKETKQ